MDLGISGRVALVAAGSRGLGYASARQLALEGVRVSLCSRSTEASSDAADRLRRETGAEVLGVAADLSDADETRRWVDETTDRLGPPDILVANGPGPATGSFLDHGDDQWRAACEVVVVNVARQIRLALPGMLERGWGRVVVINSFTARQPLTNLTLSNAVRAGVLGLVKTVSVEVGSRGVTVNSVLPGPTATDRLLELLDANADRLGVDRDEAGRQMAQDAPITRLGRPEEVGAAVAFLCSEPAAFITGTALTVDGGATRGI